MTEITKHWQTQNASENEKLIETPDDTATLEESLVVFYKLKNINTALPYDLAVILLNIYQPVELKTFVHIRNWRLVFIEALYIITQNWKQKRNL